MTSDTATQTRRDLLKKLAAASATAGVASTIVSSPAFAQGGTVNSRPQNITGSVTINAINDANTSATMTLTANTLAAGSCPFGNPTVARREFAWTLANVSVANGVTLSITGGTFSTTLVDAVVSGTGNINGTYDVRLTVRWVCDSRPTGATAAWLCRTFAATITHTPGNQGGGGGGQATATPGATTELTPVDGVCTATTPLPS